LAEGLLDMFGLLPGMPLGVVFFAPIALQEMVYAVWLIVKGFNPTASIQNLPSRNMQDNRSSQ
jgi:hypothetical protein